MWSCSKCNAEVEDRFENCPKCGTGRDGSEPPVDFVKKGDAFQPNLPTANQINPEQKKKLITAIIVAVVLIVVLYTVLCC